MTNINSSTEQNKNENTSSANGSTPGIRKYDFISAPEICQYLDIGLTQAYDICKTINEELASKGYLTFRGKIPRKALMEHLPDQGM